MTYLDENIEYTNDPEGVEDKEGEKAKAVLKESLPEAPASINTRIKSPNGFEYQWTIRDESNNNLLYKLKVMEKKWLLEGFTPVIGGFKSKFDTAPKVEKECPVHEGMMMTEKLAKSTNKPYFSHTKGVYPNLIRCFGKGWQEQA